MSRSNPGRQKDKPTGIPLCPVTRKGRYSKRKRALGALNFVRSKGEPVTYVYKCRHCGDWHMTSRVDRAA